MCGIDEQARDEKRERNQINFNLQESYCHVRFVTVLNVAGGGGGSVKPDKKCGTAQQPTHSTGPINNSSWPATGTTFDYHSQPSVI